MKVVIYGRTSGDEEDGQDIDAQMSQLGTDAEEAGYEVVGEYQDEGVSGSVDPFSREGFVDAHIRAEEEGAALWVRDWSRFSRMHPSRAMDALDRCKVPVLVARDAAITVQAMDDQGPADAGMAFFAFFGPWQYRAAAVASTRAAMEAIKNGQRATRSGKAPGRERKVSDAELVQALLWAIEADPAEAARRLSTKRGADDAKDERTRKKRRVARTTLLRGWREYLGVSWPLTDEQKNQVWALRVPEGRLPEAERVRMEYASK